ncbi:unnamed protein product [Phyllotreta striolata]|uniref:Ankyrin repeat domain-containing protein 6 n=1 Tax=Phyllotreta striolata TaxID=444603 RepID=A0A9N9TV29_PHYSR|nr:unnamed protein product [Phyllotreta striolata]
MNVSDAVGGVVATPSTVGAELREAAGRGDVAACRRHLGAARLARFSRDDRGRTALHLAASNGRRDVVRLLLSVAAPGEVDAADAAGCAALQRAASEGHEEVMRLVLARGGDVNGQDHVHGNTALHEASWKGYSKSVRLLASAGAHLNRRNAGGFTALHLSCQNGHNQTCRELLLAGCDPDIQNNYGDTALHTAARYGHAGVTRILLSAQCRVSEQNKNGDTALHIASAMGRRKLTRILLEAGCAKGVRNKQNETAAEIAVRKDLFEIVDILNETGAFKDGRRAKSVKKRSKSKVKFDESAGKEVPLEPKPWSPYGCHYFPDPKNFPSPRLDSLPQEPLKKGEQYYLDLAGNICKGPIGVGYTCYCAPLFKHLEARIEKDKKELQKAHFRLKQRVIGLEQKLKRGQQARRSERVLSTSCREKQTVLPRSRSLEMLYDDDKPQMQTTRSMDELDPPEEATAARPSVKEIVAKIQRLNVSNQGNDSESSEEDDLPAKGDRQSASNPGPSSLDFPGGAVPRSRTGVYSPTIVNSVLVNHVPLVEIRDSASYAPLKRTPVYRTDVGFVEPYKIQYYDNAVAERRILNGPKSFDGDDGAAASASVPDNIDRDTNNDSGYSTKVYGSSKGNSPSLCGKIDGDCLGSSSLV